MVTLQDHKVIHLIILSIIYIYNNVPLLNSLHGLAVTVDKTDTFIWLFKSKISWLYAGD